MPTIHDKEFGDIVVRSQQNASRITIKIAPDGRLRASAPPRTPTLAVKALIATSRGKLREMVAAHQEAYGYTSDMPIGKSHSLIISQGVSTAVRTSGTTILAQVGPDDAIDRPAVQAEIRTHVLKALRKEASNYLPRRLKHLADKHGFTYGAVKITHAGTRWGSCSSRGTISLNISLMQLPFELLDYVLVHELAHTKHMNHSSNFWDEVARMDPDYKTHRTRIKQYSPYV